MPRVGAQKLALLIGGILIVAALVVYKILAAKPSADARRAAAPLVKTTKSKRETIVYQLKFNGDVLPIRQAAIFSKVSGNLEKNLVDMGAEVKVNQLLAVIDSTELHQQYQQVSATYYNNQQIFQRNKQLFERNLVSKQDVDNAEAAMKVAQATLEAAATRLSYARITAPFAGTVTRRFLDAGALVTPSNSILFNLMDLDTVKVIVNVLEKDVPLVPRVKSANVVLDALADKEFVGSMAANSQAVDLTTRTMAVEVRVPNRSHIIKPGMFATVTLVWDEKRDALTIPTSCLLRDNDGYFVFVADNKTARRVRVQAGAEQNFQTEILSGLSGEEEIISTGQQFVKDGGPINILP
ncbi:MAG: efflux RND transporter periplasmic adaptor subunit [Ignavibacteriales bacterium]|nr:efflux RND transporter periplasmic adaptor subunit [Ignavibacteriales bacterium]